MARPRVFVSSTYYDLRHVRERIEDFIETLGYEAVLFESGDIPFRSDSPLDHSCYAEIANCHMLVLVIGGRYGTPASGDELPTTEDEKKKFFQQYNSITRKEYEVAASKDLPIFIFVEQGVMGEFQTFKRNRNSTEVSYAHVDSANVFLLLDEILGQPRNNLVKPFGRIDDITSWLQDQWAGLFADMLVRQREQTEIASISSRLQELKDVTDGLKTYSEEILKGTLKKKADAVITEEHKRLKEATLKRFAKEPLIRYVLRHLKRAATPDFVYLTLENTKNLREFFERLELPGYVVDRLCDSPSAKREYVFLRRSYLGVDIGDLEVDQIGLSPSIVGILANAGITRVSELMAVNLTDIGGIGDVRASEIEYALRQLDGHR